MALNMNQYGVVFVGLFNRGQHKKGVARLVAQAFIERNFPAYNTPINIDGDRWNNSVNNLAWRPRWFAVKYNRQFSHCSAVVVWEDCLTDEHEELWSNYWLYYLCIDPGQCQ